MPRSIGMTRAENENRSQIPDPEGFHSFAMFHMLEARNYFSYIKERKLQPRDFTVLFALMSLCDAKTGKIRFTAKVLSEEIGFNPTAFSASLKRLKTNFVIASICESSGDKYYLINPYLFSVGRKQKWGHLVKTFTDAFN